METRQSIVLATALLVTALWGAAPAAASDETTTGGRVDAAASDVFWSWIRPNSAVGVSDAGILIIEWTETFEGGTRTSATVDITYTGAAGDGTCRISIDDEEGTANASGTISFLHTGSVPCQGASAGVSEPDGNGLCTASAFFVGIGSDGFGAQFQGAGTGPCSTW